MGRLSIEMYQYLYRVGGLDTKQIIKLVQDEILSEDDFKIITGYNYQGYLENEKRKGRLY